MGYFPLLIYSLDLDSSLTLEKRVFSFLPAVCFQVQDGDLSHTAIKPETHMLTLDRNVFPLRVASSKYQWYLQVNEVITVKANGLYFLI